MSRTAEAWIPEPVDQAEELAEVIRLADYRSETTVYETELDDLIAENSSDDTTQLIALADETPELGAIRKLERQRACRRQEQRFELRKTERKNEVPPAMSVFGTANRVVEALDTHGENSPEYDAAQRLFDLDIERLIQEAFSRMTYAYSEAIEHKFDVDNDTFLANGYSVDEMTDLGLAPMNHPEESNNRINDRVEDRTAVHFFKLNNFRGKPIGEWRMLSVLECPDWAVRQYVADQVEGNVKATYGGYFPVVRKMAIRMFRFDQVLGSRFQEQVFMPGTELEHDDLVDTLQSAQFIPYHKRPSKTELRGTQIIVHESVMSDVLEAAEFIDLAASKKAGVPVFMGELVSADHQRDYSKVPEEALQRKAEQTQAKHKVREFVLRQRILGINEELAAIRLTGFLANVMHDIAEADPGSAEVMFDKQTADGYRRFNDLRDEAQALFEIDPTLAQLRMGEARQERQATRQAAPSPDFCSGGSCDVEMLLLEEAALAKTLNMVGFKLDGRNRETFLRKKNAHCTKCGSSRTVIGFGQKGCLGCRTVIDIGPLALYKEAAEKRKAKATAAQEVRESVAALRSVKLTSVAKAPHAGKAPPIKISNLKLR